MIPFFQHTKNAAPPKDKKSPRKDKEKKRRSFFSKQSILQITTSKKRKSRGRVKVQGDGKKDSKKNKNPPAQASKREERKLRTTISRVTYECSIFLIIIV